MQDIKSKYEKMLNSNEVVKSNMELHAKVLAFENFVSQLGKQQDIAPDLAKGSTLISIPAYFRLPKFANNPLNAAALDILPRYSYSNTYGNSVSTTVNNSGFRRLMRRTDVDNGLQAAREGDLYQAFMRERLGLNYFNEIDSSDYDEFTLEGLVYDITKDYEDAAVGDVKDIAGYVNERGYVDFFDYLMEAKQVIDERVEILFSHPANGSAQELTMFS